MVAVFILGQTVKNAKAIGEKINVTVNADIHMQTERNIMANGKTTNAQELEL